MSEPEVDTQVRDHSGELLEILGGRLRLAPREAPRYLSVNGYDIMTKTLEDVRGDQAPRPSGTIYRDSQSLLRWLIPRQERSPVLVEDFHVSRTTTRFRRVLLDLYCDSSLH